MERMKKVGKMAMKPSSAIKDSPMGLGMEKLDRDSFDPSLVYDKAAALGVKWIRLQSGWQKTEKEKGVYDFSWLDEQVDNLLSRGMKPWLCLCYGNRVWDELAKQYQGAVGCPPVRTPEQREAWIAYVSATARHFAGRITYYEIWNEAEGGWTWRPSPNLAEYAKFACDTAAAVRAADPKAKIMTGSHYEDTLRSFVIEAQNGTLECSDVVTYHSYNYDERMTLQRALALRAFLDGCGHPEIEVVQGESGSQSKTGGNGALSWVRTDEGMQVKQILRHTVADLLGGVKFTSVFSAVDMAENLDAREGQAIATCGYFGLLGADFDPHTGRLIGEYTPKPSYYAFGNLCALFDCPIHPTPAAVIFRPGTSGRIDGYDVPTKELIYGCLEKENGVRIFAYWNSTDMVTVKEYEATVSFELSGMPGKAEDVRLIDPRDGSIYEIPGGVMINEYPGFYRFVNLPVLDYPLFVVFGGSEG